MIRRVAIGTLGCLAAYHLAGVLYFVPDRQGDFRIFYESARLWQAGRGAYTDPGIGLAPNLNHPILLPLFLPFAWLPMPIAAAAWTIGSILSGLICLHVTAKQARVATGPLALALFASAPAALALGLGQVAFVLLPILLAAWQADRSGRDVRAGIWLGLLTTLKPFYGLFGIYLLWRRSWAAALAYGSTILAGYALGWLFVGTAGYQQWLAALGTVDWQGHLYNTSVWGVATRWFAPSPTLIPVGWTTLIVSPQLTTLTGWILAAAVVAVLLHTISGDRDRDYAAIALASVLLSPLGWLHYLVVAVPPIVAVAARRPSTAWAVPIGLALVPSVIVVGRIYGVIGTVLLGVWAISISGGLFLLCSRVPLFDVFQGNPWHWTGKRQIEPRIMYRFDPTSGHETL